MIISFIVKGPDDTEPADVQPAFVSTLANWMAQHKALYFAANGGSS